MHKETPLTLQQLVGYSQEILFPAMEERFATKSELENFRNQTLSNHDQIFKKLDILLTEKEVGEYQKGKERKMWLIMIGAMKRSNILTLKELETITQLEIF